MNSVLDGLGLEGSSLMALMTGHGQRRIGSDHSSVDPETIADMT